MRAYLLQSAGSGVIDLVAAALAEDLGGGDVTTAATVNEAARARARIVQKAPGVIFGLDFAEQAFRALDPDVALERRTAEGAWREDGRCWSPRVAPGRC